MSAEIQKDCVAGVPRLLRLSDVLKIIPVCRASWYVGIAKGRFPRPVKLGRTSVWRAEEIRQVIEQAPRG
jgi:predicted DNA-binding transcriptional regulator AlpA